MTEQQAPPLTIQEFLDARWTAEEDAWKQGIGLLTQPQFASLSRSMLTELAAKRTILRMHDGFHECPSIDDNCGWWMPRSLTFDGDTLPECPTTRLLAQAYVEHPDFRSEWL